MRVKHAFNVSSDPVEGVPGVTIRWLLDRSDGTPNFALRLFEVQPGETTPFHTHPYEHEVYILTGRGTLRGEKQSYPLAPDDTVLVLPNEPHQFVNEGEEILRFLCVIPLLGDDIALGAQVSLYPLRQEALSPAIDTALHIFNEHGLEVQPGSMSTLILGNESNIFNALQQAFHKIAEQGELVMVATFSNACPLPSDKTDSTSLRAIGHVENEFNEPTSSDQLRATVSRVVLNPELTDGLRGLNPGSRVMVIFSFHRAEGYELLQHPRGDKTRAKRGVFTLRSPHRPNPIGVTEVELLSLEGNVLRVRGLDAINGTPVLDLKPA